MFISIHLDSKKKIPVQKKKKKKRKFSFLIGSKLGFKVCPVA